MTPDRFFTLTLLLGSRDAVTTQELASALGVFLRTVTTAAESRRALAKIAAAQPHRLHELLPLTDIVHVDSRPWRQPPATCTTPASLTGALRRALRLRIEDAGPRESCPRDRPATNERNGSSAHLRALDADLAHHCAPPPTP